MTQHEALMENSLEKPEEAFTPAANTRTLRSSVEETLNNYFADIDGQPVNNVYDMVLSEIEAPMLEVVMRYAHNNQCKAARILGLNRGTLRKKLKRYGLL
jgi:Fis family transcriptional regulator